MESRYRLENRKYGFFVESENNESGIEFLKEVRKTTPFFKGSRIRGIIQALPDKVILRQIYKFEQGGNYGQNKE